MDTCVQSTSWRADKKQFEHVRDMLRANNYIFRRQKNLYGKNIEKQNGRDYFLKKINIILIVLFRNILEIFIKILLYPM